MLTLRRRLIFSALAALLLAAAGCSQSPERPSKPQGSPGDGVSADTDAPTDTDASGDIDPGADSDGDNDVTDEDPIPTVRDIVGVYSISGTDPALGAYQGEAEIRMGPTPETFDVIHTLRFDVATFEGMSIAQVWQGSIQGVGLPTQITTTLKARDFMVSYDGATRDTNAPATILVRADLRLMSEGELEVSVPPPSAPGSAAVLERWLWLRSSAAEPLWRNDRVVVAAHEPLSDSTRSNLFRLYDSYYDVPDVAPYVERPEFQAAVHSFVYDRTDFDYLRDNPNTVRVIQGGIDKISLAEARLRNYGFAYTLAQKAARFDADAPVYHLNEAGLFANWSTKPGEPGIHTQSGDGLLWSGTYLVSQAMRYLTTHETAALDNVKRVLDGMFVCHDITQTLGGFCRTLRMHVPDGNPLWQRGTGAYAHLDWLKGGNNDMAHGLEIGFLWGVIALREAGGDPVREQRVRDLTQEFIDHNDIMGDGNVSEMKWRLLLYFFGRDWNELLRYTALFAVVEPLVVDNANGVTFQGSALLDSSGLHLNTMSYLTLWQASRELGLDDQSQYGDGIKKSLEIVEQTRLPLLQLFAGVLSSDVEPGVLVDAVRALEEYPITKEFYDIDHRLSPEFCMSPWPSLPWKNDWTTSDRTHSLVGYPMFEQTLDHDYQWKRDPFWFRGSNQGGTGSNADFLLAYWFARYHGVFGPGF